MTGEIPAAIGGSRAGSFVFLSFPPSYPGRGGSSVKTGLWSYGVGTGRLRAVVRGWYGGL